jgi:DNA repair protein RecO (recombination protein O)
MAQVKTSAVILHSFAYGDTSRILRILTPEYGLRSVIAKGAKSPRSRFGGVLEPFTEGEAQFHLRPGRDLLTLGGFSLLRSRQAIGRDFAAFAGASLIAEILVRVGTEEANAELYDAVVSTFDRLATPHRDAAGIALASLWNLIALFGFRPEMEACVQCGAPIAKLDAARFDTAAGGARCSRCGTNGPVLDPALRREILVMTSTGGRPGESSDRDTHAVLLRAYLTAHLFQGRPLRSLPLFLEQLR